MADYSRAFSGGASCGCSTTCVSTAYNSTSATTPSGATIFDGLDPAVTTTADAVGVYVDELRRRLAARFRISSVSNVQFTVVLIRGSREDNLTITVGTNGQYPIVAVYNTPDDIGTSVSFWSATQFVDYFVEILK